MNARALVGVTGRVQGVAFRAYAQREAVRLGLSGWAENLTDGSVELAAEGPREEVEAFVSWCRKGPRHARVEAVRVRWEQPGGDLHGFDIRG